MSTGKASSARIEVNSTFQVKIGIRKRVIPGARRHTMVVMKLTDPRMVLRPDTARPMIQRSAPTPGEKDRLPLRGAYANQPKAAEPFAVRNPLTTMSPPNKYTQ
ncbi:hypothetical protein SAVIM40S_02456 [Streptomyces avidinii]